MKSSAPWTLTAQQVVAQQQTSLETGLTAAEVQKRREQHGFNELDKEPGKPLWKLVLEQFDDMLVKVAAVAADALWRESLFLSPLTTGFRTAPSLVLCPCACM
jgi:magnesium-transporting ATPase (P-type)